MMDTNNLDILYKRQRHNTLQDLFAYAVTNYANAPAFLIDDKETKETYSLSYRDFGAQVMMLAHQLRSKGYHRDTIAIMGNNSPAWVDKSKVCTYYCRAGRYGGAHSKR